MLREYRYYLHGNLVTGRLSERDAAALSAVLLDDVDVDAESAMESAPTVETMDAKTAKVSNKARRTRNKAG